MDDKTLKEKILISNAKDERMLIYFLRETCGYITHNLATIIKETSEGATKEKLTSIYQTLVAIKNGKNPHELAKKYEDAIEIRNKLLNE